MKIIKLRMLIKVIKNKQTLIFLTLNHILRIFVKRATEHAPTNADAGCSLRLQLICFQLLLNICMSTFRFSFILRIAFQL